MSLLALHAIQVILPTLLSLYYPFSYSTIDASASPPTPCLVGGRRQSRCIGARIELEQGVDSSDYYREDC